MKNHLSKHCRFLLVLPLALTALTVAGCASTSKEEGELNGTIGSLYNDGMDQLAKGNYKTAIHNFDELQRQYPYSGWATRAELMSAYASLKSGDESTAVITADHFIKMHPGHPDLAYMYYLKGIAAYRETVDVYRDQSTTQQALDAFQQVVEKFPNSVYAEDSRQKIILCQDQLAGKEMAVGRYYQARGEYLPAVNRFKTVIDQYPSTTQTPEALYRLTESYTALGVPEEAQKNAAILGRNYPESTWYTRAYALASGKELPETAKPQPWYKKVGPAIRDVF